MKNADLKTLLQRVIELVMPNLRAYYRVVRKARVVKSYASNGKYWADVQPLRNDNSPDPDEPVVPKVEIPIMWAGPDRGVVCPPVSGTYCDLEYYDGDPDYPRISNFRWHNHGAPAIDVGGFIIQHSAGTYIKIDPGKNIITATPGNLQENVGGNKGEYVSGAWTVNVQGDATLAAGGNASVTAGGRADISAPIIGLNGEVTSSGGTAGVMTLDCDLVCKNIESDGNIHATGTIIDELGNTDHHPGH